VRLKKAWPERCGEFEKKKTSQFFRFLLLATFYFFSTGN
jgi:hypothetical protein